MTFIIVHGKIRNNKFQLIIMILYDNSCVMSVMIKNIYMLYLEYLISSNINL